MAPKQQKPSLIDALGTVPPPYYANRCSVGRVMERLTDEEKAAYQTALDQIATNLRDRTSAQGGVTAKWLEQTLARYEIRVSERMIRRHCRQECSCESR